MMSTDIEAALELRSQRGESSGGYTDSIGTVMSERDEESIIDDPSASAGAIAVHCFFVAAIAGCCYATLAATGFGQSSESLAGDAAGSGAEQLSMQLPGSAILDARQDLRSAITFALGGLMTFFAQSGSSGRSGRQAVKRLSIVASLI